MLDIHKVNKKEGVSEADFVRICPSLIHQLYEGVCKQPSSEMEERADNKMLHGEWKIKCSVIFLFLIS